MTAWYTLQCGIKATTQAKAAWMGHPAHLSWALCLLGHTLGATFGARIAAMFSLLATAVVDNRRRFR